MRIWEWECAIDVISGCTVVDSGPLHGPIDRVSLTRNEDLKLVLETVSTGVSKRNVPQVPAGTVKRSIEKVVFSCHLGTTAVAQGVIPYRLDSRHFGHETSNTELSHVHLVEWHGKDTESSQYTLQWLENMPDGLMWPHSVNRKETDSISIEYQSDDLKILFDDAIDEASFGKSCVHLSLLGFEFFLVKASKLKIAHIHSPGFILYKGCPTEDEQDKIKNILSFCLGQFLVDLGFASFDRDWSLTHFVARSAHTMRGAALKIITAPPSLLDKRFQHSIDKVILQNMATAVALCYEEFDLRHVFWTYWYAQAAPAHTAAVHYGAAIEYLQRRYAERRGDRLKTTIINDEMWAVFSRKMVELISELPTTDDEKGILKRKCQSLNSAPQSVLMERFFAALGIDIGKVESSAWGKRNRAAHGGKISEEKYIEVIRDNKVLMIMLNRILIAISGCSDNYHNYYSVGHPVSSLSVPIPVEEK